MADVSNPLSPWERDLLSTLDGTPARKLGPSAAAKLMGQHYEIEGDLSPLTAELDENFRVRTTSGDDAIFKIFGSSRAEEAASLLAATLAYLERTAPDLPVPRVMAGRGGAILRFLDEDGRDRRAILYSFLPGKPLMDAPRQLEQYRQSGALLAKLACALRGFQHPAMHRLLIWDLRNVSALRGIVHQLPDLAFRPFLLDFLDVFARDIAGALTSLPHQFVHNDFNARNILVSAEDDSHICGVIDFGDALFTARIADVAVGVIGQLSAPDCATLAMDSFVAAYESVSPVETLEKQLLPWLVAARIVQNIVMTSWYRSRQPDAGHFVGFDVAYFAWRKDFAQALISNTVRS